MTDVDHDSVTQTLTDLLMKSGELDALQRHLERVNILEVFRITRYELAHSSFWCWLFDPKGTHKMGDRFLRAFLRFCTLPRPEAEAYRPPWPTPELLDVEGADLDRAVVGTEKKPSWMQGRGADGDRIAGRRFDIQIEFDLPSETEGVTPPKALVIVEFKIEAQEGDRQTQDYTQAIQTAVAEGVVGYTHALAIFVDFLSRAPEDPNFLPVSLQEMVTSVLRPILDSSPDIIPEGVARLLQQYRLAVDEEYEDTDPKVQSFCETHREALSILRDYIAWTPDLEDLVGPMKPIPDGAKLMFRDTKRSPEVPGVLLLQDGQVMIQVLKQGCEDKFFNTLNKAANAAGRSARSYNGWSHWFYENKSLSDWRQHAKRERDVSDRLCEAIINGRKQAVEHLIGLAGEELLSQPTTAGRRSSSGAPTLLADFVNYNLLKVDQVLFFRKDEQRTCTVKKDGERVVLLVGDTTFDTPSGASAFLNAGRASNGFNDLYFKDADGSFHRIDELRQQYKNLIQVENVGEENG